MTDYRVPPCPVCCTWTCTTCGFQRHNAALIRPHEQACPHCNPGALTSSWPVEKDEVRGIFRPTRHRTWEKYLSHVQSLRELADLYERQADELIAEGLNEALPHPDTDS